MRREFPARVKVAAYERSKGLCEQCGGPLQVGRFHYDHVIPDGLGGEPILENCRVLCRGCHGTKTATEDVPRIAKMKRTRASHLGARASRNPMPCGRTSKWKKTLSGKLVPRFKD